MSTNQPKNLRRCAVALSDNKFKYGYFHQKKRVEGKYAKTEEQCDIRMNKLKIA